MEIPRIDALRGSVSWYDKFWGTGIRSREWEWAWSSRDWTESQSRGTGRPFRTSTTKQGELELGSGGSQNLKNSKPKPELPPTPGWNVFEWTIKNRPHPSNQKSSAISSPWWLESPLAHSDPSNSHVHKRLSSGPRWHKCPGLPRKRSDCSPANGSLLVCLFEKEKCCKGQSGVPTDSENPTGYKKA